jgi:Zn-dependent oligopeptidase
VQAFEVKERDGIELPSQIMESRARHPEMMRSYARHYESNAPIPDALIQKILQSQTLNQGAPLWNIWRHRFSISTGIR